jgi:hypothetical protein
MNGKPVVTREKRPRSIFLVTYLIILGLMLLRLQQRHEAVQGVDPTTATIAQMATMNMDWGAEALYGALGALIYAAIIAVPVDMIRRIPYNRERKAQAAADAIKVREVKEKEREEREANEDEEWLRKRRW